MTKNQPPTVEERLSRLETLFVNVGEKVAEHDGNIDVLVANIQELKETVRNLTEQTTHNINRLAEEAAFDRQQAAIDRQQAAFDRQQAAIDRQNFNQQMEQRQRETQQIWEYLRDRNGGSPPPQAN